MVAPYQSIDWVSVLPNGSWVSVTLLNGEEVVGRIAMPISFRADKVLIYREGSTGEIGTIIPMSSVARIEKAGQEGKR